MGTFNKITMIGHLGGDPEQRIFDKGSKTTFSVATNRAWKNTDGELQKETDWHRVVAWGPLGERCHVALEKGSQVYVEGRVQTRSWEDNDGNTRYITEVVAGNVVFLGSRQKGGEAAATL